jgi:phosphate transport system substrate-binding protein
MVKEEVMKPFVVLLCLAVFWVGGCATMSSQPSTSPQSQWGTVVIPGTGDSQDLLRALANDYMEQYPERQVEIPDSIDSTGGLKVVAKGQYAVGRSSRRQKPEEIDMWGEVKHLVFARVPIAFVVSDEVTGVTRLSEQQLCAIFRGDYLTWDRVGGPQGLPIEVQNRPEGSNWLTIRKHITCFKNLQVTPTAEYNLRNQDLVQSMQTKTGAIGFMPHSEAKLYGIKTVKLNSIAPTNQEYPLGIELSLVYIKPFSPSIQAFVDYLKTKSARHIMNTTGHVSVDIPDASRLTFHQTR